MGNAMQDAARDIERGLKMFPGLAALGTELNRVGSLQQAADEADSRTATAKARKDELIVEIDALHQKSTAADEEIAKKLAVANDQAAQITGKAHADAADITANANKVLQEASDHADSLRAEALEKADAIVNAAKTTAASYDTQIADGKKALDALNAQIDARQATLDAINAKLDEVRSKL